MTFRVILYLGMIWIACGLEVLSSIEKNLVQSLSAKEIQIHIFTFQRDENTFLMDWFNYHSYLVGNPKHIHIIDHNSTDPTTVGFLADIRRRGGHVIPYSGAFMPGMIYTSVMKRYVDESAFLIPLDGKLGSYLFI